MSVWHVFGGNRLSGSITVQGAKNAVLPIMRLRCSRPARSSLNVPSLRDVEKRLRACAGLDARLNGRRHCCD
jgi:UDP-N-acetylglucosamine enolpyruvyl transferase